MKIGMIGLGRMGMNMARRLLQGGHEVVVYNRTRDKIDGMVGEGAEGAYTLEEMANKLTPPRVAWMMLPAGAPVDEHIAILEGVLSEGDIVVDGGNSYYKDDIRRESQLSQRGLKYVDAGVSGGIWGLKVGYCLMVGGPRDAFDYLEPALATLAPPEGYLYCGKSGGGHFVKMVHNGIEYAMMQAYAEGYDIIEASPYAESIHYGELSHLWNQGSVIRSWLLELMESAFEKDPKLTDIKGYVQDSGEGRWTVQQAVDTGVAAPLVAMALFMRFRSRETDSFSNRVLAAMRREFGGHAVVKADD
jgi:6-phosphogluconate dehydrogenase